MHAEFLITAWDQLSSTALPESFAGINLGVTRPPDGWLLNDTSLTIPVASVNPSFLASPVLVPLSTRILAFLSTAVPPLADLSRPYYMYSAPNLNFAPGKAVMGVIEDLKSKVLGPKGELVEARSLASQYSFSEYRDRGKVTTDPSTGGFEVLTVPPGIYGILGAQRVAHIHGIMTALGYQSLTTQLYFCPKNELTGFSHPDPRPWRERSVPSEKDGRYIGIGRSLKRLKMKQ
ncbi:unnamed protein product [Rhizoctonia solani]|uniref:Uncharacterized protein n=1 Tax=Rhizoctonia solani TaxID=456999 RepID=A0A8H3I095_9AGAM|nr:unnamed protein product [Rhizoctonia solani]